jgi:hypothetical protein
MVIQPVQKIPALLQQQQKGGNYGGNKGKEVSGGRSGKATLLSEGNRTTNEKPTENI